MARRSLFLARLDCDMCVRHAKRAVILSQSMRASSHGRNAYVAAVRRWCRRRDGPGFHRSSRSGLLPGLALRAAV